MKFPSRRLLVLSLPALLAGCVSNNNLRFGGSPSAGPDGKAAPLKITQAPVITQPPEQIYAQVTDNDITIPAAPISRIDPQFYRQVVDFNGPEPVGSVVVDPDARFLYVVYEGGKALRYGVGVGRAGFGWTGDAIIKSKQQWPKWFPTPEARERDPSLQKFAAEGLPSGIKNPLGARAHYLWKDKKDTYYRIHGTSEPWTIGTNVSTGCIRMINQDAIDLYTRIPEGTPVIVRKSKIATIKVG